MSVLARYVVRETLAPMWGAVLVSLLVLLAERTLRLVDMVVDWRGSLSLLVEMLGFLVPHYMGVALPAAFFLGLFIATGRLARDRELDAMQAGGVSLWTYARPLVWTGVVLALVHLLLVGWLQPYGRYGYRAATYTLTNVSFQVLLEPQVFTTLERTTWYVATLDDARERFTGLFLHSESENGDSLVITAKRGRIVVEGLTQPTLLELEDGVQQILPAARTLRRGEDVPAALTLRFRHFTSDLRGERPLAFRPRGADERELTLDELYALRNAGRGDIEVREVRAELLGRLVRSLSIPFLPLFVAPLAVGRMRGRRSYGFVVGLVLLVGYHQLLKTLESLADDGVLDPLAALVPAFLAFAVGSTWMFVRRVRMVPDPARGAALDRLYEALRRRLLAGVGART
ncbi:hypothetical protein HRbin39_00673 [bacterium HR39]|nr:hypothetical protein HRbin39_00673 [bacterium HR39]